MATLTLTIPDQYLARWDNANRANNPGADANTLKAISGKKIADTLLAALVREEREASKRAASQQIAAGEFSVAVEGE